MKCCLLSMALQFVWRSRIVFSRFLDCPGNLKNVKEKHLFSCPLMKESDYSSLVKEGLPFAWDISLENSEDSYLCFWLTLLHLVPYHFSLYKSSFSSLCKVFDTTSWSYMRFSESTHLLMYFSLETLRFIRRTD